MLVLSHRLVSGIGDHWQCVNLHIVCKWVRGGWLNTVMIAYVDSYWFNGCVGTKWWTQ